VSLTKPVLSCVGIVWFVIGIVWFEIAKIKGAKIILHAKSTTFRAATLRVLRYC